MRRWKAAASDVMVFLRYAFTVTATGKGVATNLHHYWRFRDGKVAYYRGSEDTASSLRRLAPERPGGPSPRRSFKELFGVVANLVVEEPPFVVWM
jgi:hypothetical protein